jgi:hypothetical protein
VLAGFGAAELEKPSFAKATIGRKRGVMIAIALLVTIEAIRTPVGFTRFNGIPQVYDRLASPTTWWSPNSPSIPAPASA